MGLQPVLSFEEIEGKAGRNEHQGYSEPKPIFPVKLTGVVEVHAVNTRNQSGWHKHHRGHSKDFDNFVLLDIHQTHKRILKVFQSFKIEVGVVYQ